MLLVKLPWKQCVLSQSGDDRKKGVGEKGTLVQMGHFAYLFIVTGWNVLHSSSDKTWLRSIAKVLPVVTDIKVFLINK